MTEGQENPSGVVPTHKIPPDLWGSNPGIGRILHMHKEVSTQIFQVKPVVQSVSAEMLQDMETAQLTLLLQLATACIMQITQNPQIIKTKPLGVTGQRQEKWDGWCKPPSVSGSSQINPAAQHKQNGHSG